MRGDTEGAGNIEEEGVTEEYIHTYDPNMEPIYRKNIFKRNIRFDSADFWDSV
jgi:hypothetical protein